MDDAQVVADTKACVAEVLFGSDALLDPNSARAVLWPEVVSFISSTSSNMWQAARRRVAVDRETYKRRVEDLENAFDGG